MPPIIMGLLQRFEKYFFTNLIGVWYIIDMKKEIKNPVMTLITKAQYKKLMDIGHENMIPIVKIFGGSATWLLTHIDEDGIAYGYADLGMGCVEWGSLFEVTELETLRYGKIFYFERDRWFEHKEGTNYLEMTSLVGI